MSFAAARCGSASRGGRGSRRAAIGRAAIGQASRSADQQLVDSWDATQLGETSADRSWRLDNPPDHVCAAVMRLDTGDSYLTPSVNFASQTPSVNFASPGRYAASVTHSGDKGNYWVPVDKYKVRAKLNESCALLQAMEDIRNLVLLGKYDPNNRPRISYSKLHAACIAATSPTRRTKGCGCRNGNCKNTCGCKKNNVKCHSGCRCNGNCFNGNCISPMKVPANDKFG